MLKAFVNKGRLSILRCGNEECVSMTTRMAIPLAQSTHVKRWLFCWGGVRHWLLTGYDVVADKWLKRTVPGLLRSHVCSSPAPEMRQSERSLLYVQRGLLTGHSNEGLTEGQEK